ncbi:hypothetical protein AXG93_1793s1240 [Marchantia polymorpha subsp. ruderalis]|uniref:Uncharacterized protein n=1 Tax=Marchantia polymorpha subsp. ruderalis TaxID=1480154 RepID=A0A176WIL8_MARPO|nr:hypothetical protein AXG93_1793s1240 [Marchantia polymorpha subsp. ruderalis]
MAAAAAACRSCTALGRKRFVREEESVDGMGMCLGVVFVCHDEDEDEGGKRSSSSNKGGRIVRGMYESYVRTKRSKGTAADF